MSQIKCSEATLKTLRSHPNYKFINGRSKMKKDELCKAINKTLKKREGDIHAKCARLGYTLEPKLKSPSKIRLVPDIETLIQHRLDIKDLLKSCRTDKAMIQKCSSSQFWKPYFEQHHIRLPTKTDSWTVKEWGNAFIISGDIERLLGTKIEPYFYQTFMLVQSRNMIGELDPPKNLGGDNNKTLAVRVKSLKRFKEKRDKVVISLTLGFTQMKYTARYWELRFGLLSRDKSIRWMRGPQVVRIWFLKDNDGPTIFYNLMWYFMFDLGMRLKRYSRDGEGKYKIMPF